MDSSHKRENSAIIYTLKLFQTCLQLNTIVKNMGHQTLMDPIDFHSMENNTMEVGPSTVWLLTFFKISSFVFSWRQVWDNLRVMMTLFIFVWTIALKDLKCSSSQSKWSLFHYGSWWPWNILQWGFI